MHLLFGGRARAWNVLWPAKARKNLELFEMHTCLWRGAQTSFRHKWRNLVTAFLSLHSFDGYICLRYGNEFFSAVFHNIYWSFLVLHFDWKVCNWIPNVVWPRLDWFSGLLLENGFFRWLHICLHWHLQEWLNCYSFLSSSIFFDV